MPTDPTLYNTPAPPVGRGGQPVTPTAPTTGPTVNLPFGLSNLPLFRVGFWYRFGVSALGIVFLWWAVLIFIASSKAGKAAAGVISTAAFPEGTLAKTVGTRAGNAVVNKVTNKL